MADAATKSAPEGKKPKQGRSPAYPAMSLKVALEKAKAQFDTEGKYPAPMSSAFAAWGFGAKSSGGRDVRAALKYFGLATVEGDGETGKVKLTDEALRVLLDEREDQTEKKAIIRRLALNPAVHKKLLEQFPEGIKSDASAEHFLVFEQGFNKSAAGAAVTEFKETATFAELFKPATVLDKIDPPDEDEVDSLAGVTVIPPGVKPGRIGPEVKVMAGERIAFTEEGQPGQYLKLIASGTIDDTMLEALEDYVKRQRKRLASAVAFQMFKSGEIVPVSGHYALHHFNHQGKTLDEYHEGQRFKTCHDCGGDGVRYSLLPPDKAVS